MKEYKNKREMEKEKEKGEMEIKERVRRCGKEAHKEEYGLRHSGRRTMIS